MSKQDFEHWKRTKQLQRAGWRVEPVRAVQPHHGPETADHFLLKAALAYVIEQRGRPWATEVEHPERGRPAVALKHQNSAAALIPSLMRVGFGSW